MSSLLLMIFLNIALFGVIHLFEKLVMARVYAKVKKPWQILSVFYSESAIIVSLITYVFGVSMVWPLYGLFFLNAILTPWKIRRLLRVQRDLFYYDIRARVSDAQKFVESLKVHENLKKVVSFLASQQETKEGDFTFGFGGTFAPFRFMVRPEVDNKYLVEMSFDTRKVPFSTDRCMSSFILSCQNVLGLSIERKNITLSAGKNNHETKICSTFVRLEDIHWRFNEVSIPKDDKLYFGFYRSELPFRHLSFLEQNTLPKKEIGREPFILVAACGELLELTFNPFEQFDEVYDLAKLLVEELTDLPLNVECYSDMLGIWHLIKSWEGWLGTSRKDKKPKLINPKREDEPVIWQELHKVLQVFEQDGDSESAIQTFNEAIKQRHWELGSYGNQFLMVEAGKPVFDQRRNVCQVCGKELPEENSFKYSVPLREPSLMGFSLQFVSCCKSDKCMEALQKAVNRNVEASVEINQAMRKVLGLIGARRGAKKKLFGIFGSRAKG